MNISPNKPYANEGVDVPKLKVLFGVTHEGLTQKLSDILQLPKEMDFRAFSWENSRIHPDLIRECVETPLQDEGLFQVPHAEDADIIAVISDTGYRVVRDKRAGRGPTEFIWNTNNFFVVHDIGADLTEFSKGAVNARTEHYFDNHPDGFAVTAVVVDEAELNERGKVGVATKLALTHAALGDFKSFTASATVAGMAGFMEHGKVALSLMSVGAVIDRNESIIRGNDDYGFVRQDLAQFVLWGMLKQSPKSPMLEVAQFIYTGIKFLKPDMSAELVRDVMDVSLDELGVGPWYFLLDTLKVAGIIDEAENGSIGLTSRGVHFFFLMEIVADQLGLE